MKSAVIAFCFLVSVTSCAAICNLPQKFWCSSEKIARECGVLSYCLQSHWKNRNASPVKLDIYYESYCPDSMNFVNGQLNTTWTKLSDTGVLDLRMVPYGKARTMGEEGSYKFFCQHGSDECYGNKIQNCAIMKSGHSTDIYLPIIDCMFRAYRRVNEAAEECVTRYGLNWDEVKQCADGKEGTDLLKAAGDETHALTPELNWVPWIVLDGVHDESIQDNGTANLLKLVCDAYEGTKPAECF